MSQDSGPQQSAFIDYDLPADLIAQEPIYPRDASRLLVIRRATRTLEDRVFSELHELLQPGDLLVLNDTRVLAARIGARRATGGKVEILLLERVGSATWTALINPLRRLHAGELLHVGEGEGEVRFLGREGDLGKVLLEDPSVIERFGQVPLPPYIRSELADPERYQTVYATATGSAAAPTAGLHFTDETMVRLPGRGIDVAFLTLHVGVDTFRPLTEGPINAHSMHSEWYSVPETTNDAIKSCRDRGGRIIAVGTTVARVLETIGSESAFESARLTGRTDLFIRPPYEFRVVDALVTNFHLPKTSLLLLVGAFAGSNMLRDAYAHAIQQRYRFYSFGDAMLIV